MNVIEFHAAALVAALATPASSDAAAPSSPEAVEPDGTEAMSAPAKDGAAQQEDEGASPAEGSAEEEPDYSDVEITVDERGVLVARNTQKRPEGVLHSFSSRGLDSETYWPAARRVADHGWHMYVYGDDPSVDVLDETYSPEACVVIGGVGDIGGDVFQYGFERRHDGVDGAVVVATLFDDIEEYKGKFPPPPSSHRRMRSSRPRPSQTRRASIRASPIT